MPALELAGSRRSRTEGQLATLLERTLRHEALRNERMIAWFRAIALVLTAASDGVSYLFPRETLGVDHVPLRLPMVTFALAAWSVGVLLVVRRGFYPGWLRTLLPLLDATLIAVGFSNARFVLGDEVFRRVGGLATVAASCALLALGGGLRLSRTSTAVSTAAAVLVFVGFAIGLEEVTNNLGIQVAVLLVCGLAGWWVGSVVRRVTASAVAQVALARFLPPHLVEQAHHDPLSILTAPKSLEATVLVSDLRGFTSLSERLAPPEVLAFLSDVQGRLAEAVRRHGGTVDKFMGDGMLAVFGAPEPTDRHAARALLAAREMIQEAAAWSRERVAAGLPQTGIGIGVHTGPLIAGCLGSGARLEFTVIGDTVNTASRLQDHTKELHVPLVAGARTVEEAGATATAGLEPRGEVALRGRAAPLAVWVLPADAPAVSASSRP